MIFRAYLNHAMANHKEPWYNLRAGQVKALMLAYGEENLLVDVWSFERGGYVPIGDVEYNLIMT